MAERTKRRWAFLARYTYAIFKRQLWTKLKRRLKVMTGMLLRLMFELHRHSLNFETEICKECIEPVLENISCDGKYVKSTAAGPDHSALNVHPNTMSDSRIVNHTNICSITSFDMVEFKFVTK
ncbi:uncharacterized protein ARMOST_06770 [Armillaria ostoyae]|uniref:Uncharacterized protein n=1 Tax=Armillaria ostoyae TaxID=47428 RepID=A0A284R410_ARMOS|nr:uncharacterized protein ARMOST_06770 [Armillaria ostoyae]